MKSFKVGDVVRHVGIGNAPPMTVSYTDESFGIECVWFDTTGQIHYKDFRPDALEICPIEHIMQYWHNHDWAPKGWASGSLSDSFSPSVSPSSEDES
jgi:uncharacterized protein YodC (DUF2158 family)